MCGRTVLVDRTEVPCLWGGDLWVPELGGRFEARNPSHKMLMSVLAGMSGSERQNAQARVPFVRWLAFGTDARPVEAAKVTAMARDCRLGNIATLRRTLDEHDCRLALITFDRRHSPAPWCPIIRHSVRIPRCNLSIA